MTHNEMMQIINATHAEAVCCRLRVDKATLDYNATRPGSEARMCMQGVLREYRQASVAAEAHAWRAAHAYANACDSTLIYASAALERGQKEPS